MVKENHEPSLRQQQMFSDLKKFLHIKLEVIAPLLSPHSTGTLLILVLLLPLLAFLPRP